MKPEAADTAAPWLADVAAGRLPDMLTAALWWAEQGRPVFPCSAADKRPLTRTGFKEATVDPEAIRAWWDKDPHAMIGMPTGEVSGLDVLDFDRPKRDGDPDGLATLAELEAEHGPLPATWSQATPSGGRHLIYEWAPGSPLRNKAQVLPGMDVRTTGGYIVVAPSIMSNGSAYTADTAMLDRAVPMPAFVLDAVRRADDERRAERDAEPPAEVRPMVAGEDVERQRRYAMKALDDEARQVAETRDGGRNDRLNVAAVKLGHYVGAGLLERGEVERRLLDAARDNGMVATDGAPAARATIRSGLTAGVAQPKGAPERQERRQDGAAVYDMPEPDPDADSDQDAILARLAALGLELYDGEEPDMPPFLVEGVLPEQGVAFLAGESGIGKTFAAFDLSLSVMTGTPFAGAEVKRPGGVIWIAAEGQHEVKGRLRAACIHRFGEDRPDVPFLFQTVDTPTINSPEGREKLKAMFAAARDYFRARFGIDHVLTVCDTFAKLTNFESSNDQDEMTQACREMGAHAVASRTLFAVIDHFNKNGSIMGSGNKRNHSEAVLTFEKPPEAPEAFMRIFKSKIGATGDIFPFELVPGIVVNSEGRTSCGVQWLGAREPQEVAAKEAKNRNPWAKLRYLKLALESAMARAEEITPYGGEGPRLKAANIADVKSEFWSSYVPSSDDPASGDGATRKKFARDLDKAVEAGLVMTGSHGMHKYVWPLWDGASAPPTCPR